MKENYPHWNASNGADHFMVFSYDHGKCEMAKALKFEEFGEMFSIQAYGSLVYRWACPQCSIHNLCLTLAMPLSIEINGVRIEYAWSLIFYECLEMCIAPNVYCRGI